MKKPTKLWMSLALVAAMTSTVACSSAQDDENGGNEDPDAPSGTVVIDRTFDLKTADPARMYEFTGMTVVKGLYETLLTFDGDDMSAPVPGLATMEQNDDSTEFNFTIDTSRTFSDGTAVTADDVVFSLERLTGIKGSPSFMLEGLTIEKVDDETVRITSPTSKPELPNVLTSQSTSILNMDVVMENGGTTDTSDAAESFLNNNSAGSGPYVLETMDISSQVVFKINPEYNGEMTPGYETVVLRNVDGSSQSINLRGGETNIAIDLSADQAADLGDDFTVDSSPSANVVFLLMNQDPAVSTFSSDPDFQTAVKHSIDFDRLLDVVGTGGTKAEGFVPSMLEGALSDGEGLDYDPEKAMAALEQSSYDGESINLDFPNDVVLGGVPFTTLAELIQDQLQSTGINIQLDPAPVAVELDEYRDGREEIGLWYIGPDYPDPSVYLQFTPGDLIGLRSNWESGTSSDVEALVDTARTASPDTRAGAYQEMQQAVLTDGPFLPLIQPASHLAYDNSVSGALYNPVWTIDIGLLSPQ